MVFLSPVSHVVHVWLSVGMPLDRVREPRALLQLAQATTFPIHVQCEHTDGVLYRQHDPICYTSVLELCEIGSLRLMSAQMLSARLLACGIDVHVFGLLGLINQSGFSFFFPTDFVVYWNRMQSCKL